MDTCEEIECSNGDAYFHVSVGPGVVWIMEREKWVGGVGRMALASLKPDEARELARVLNIYATMAEAELKEKRSWQ